MKPTPEIKVPSSKFALIANLACLYLLSIGIAHGSNFMWQPLPYFSEADSPFVRGIASGTIFLEDFEDQALNTPFVQQPDPLTVGYFGETYRARLPDIGLGNVWSVDGDDGAVDGNTFLGDTWITINSAGFTRSRSARFDFLPNAEGRYPSFVGVVVTRPSTFDNDVELTVRNLDGNNIFADGEFDPETWSPPGGAAGGDPRLHRFIGFRVDDGISSLRLSNVSQIDHLQYGYAIPEPSSMLLLSGIGILFARKR